MNENETLSRCWYIIYMSAEKTSNKQERKWQDKHNNNGNNNRCSDVEGKKMTHKKWKQQRTKANIFFLLWYFYISFLANAKANFTSDKFPSIAFLIYTLYSLLISFFCRNSKTTLKKKNQQTFRHCAKKAMQTAKQNKNRCYGKTKRFLSILLNSPRIFFFCLQFNEMVPRIVWPE